jgi:hypothetical protein
MRKSTKYITSVFVIITFVFFAIASGEKDKKWEPNNKNLFCGVDFVGGRYLEQIAMSIKYKTVLNEDGTYTSESGWEIIGENNKQSARDAGVGSTSDEENNFQGNWEITDSWKSDGSFEVYNPTYIKFTSSNGKISYGVIYVLDNNLQLVVIDSNGSMIDGENTEIYGGSNYTHIEAPSPK